MSRHRTISHKWRSPSEVLFVPDTPDKLEPSRSSSYTIALKQENEELKALLQIVKAKNQADKSKYLEIEMKCQEVSDGSCCTKAYV